MTSRLFGLHLRARGVPLACAGLVIGAAVSWECARWLLARRVGQDLSQARAPVAVLAPLLLVAVLSSTLAGADEQLERSTAAPWRRWRGVHGLATIAVSAVALVPAGWQRPGEFGVWALVRECVGVGGLVLLACAVLGVRLAALPVLTWLVTVWLLGLPPQWRSSRVWAWPLWPSWFASTWVVAGACCVVGLAVFAWRGARD